MSKSNCPLCNKLMATGPEYDISVCHPCQIAITGIVARTTNWDEIKVSPKLIPVLRKAYKEFQLLIAEPPAAGDAS